MTTPSAAVGWPFLIAPGRHRDYSIVLAPDFLVADLDHGVLEQVVRPTADGVPATVVEARTRAGRTLTVVFATHRLTSADLPVPGEPRDEHGRPLRLVYGFVSRYAAIGEPAGADLELARQRALAAYRRFLADGEPVDVLPAAQFPLRTRVVETARPAPRAGVPGARVSARARAPLVSSARFTIGAVVAGLAVVAVVLGGWLRSPAPSGTPCVAVSSSAGASPSAVRSPTVAVSGAPVASSATPIVSSPSCHRTVRR